MHKRDDHLIGFFFQLFKIDIDAGKFIPLQCPYQIIDQPFFLGRSGHDAVNGLAAAVTWNVRDLNWTLAGLNRGDQFRKVDAAHCVGEWNEMKTAMNTLVEQLKAQRQLPATAAGQPNAPQH